MLNKQEVSKLMMAASDYAIAIADAKNGPELVCDDVARVFAGQHGLTTFFEINTVLGLAMIMVERRGPTIRAFREDVAGAYGSRPEGGDLQ